MAFYLKCGDVLLGTLYPDDTDFPWIYCQFEPTEHFEEVKPLFDQVCKLTEKDYEDAPDDWETAGRLLDEIHAKCQLIDDHGHQALIGQISGNEASLRLYT
ncbi:hypothetical protein [Melghirimyces algeriensis]|nr:hypothetical protein [Melghirimyces algeriensis]